MQLKMKIANCINKRIKLKPINFEGNPKDDQRIFLVFVFVVIAITIVIACLYFCRAAIDIVSCFILLVLLLPFLLLFL